MNIHSTFKWLWATFIFKASWSIWFFLGFTPRLLSEFCIAFGYGGCKRFFQRLRSSAFRISDWFIFTLTASCRYTSATSPKFSASRGRCRFGFQTWGSRNISVCWIDLYKFFVTILPCYFFRFLIFIFFDRVHRLKCQELSSIHSCNIRYQITLYW